MVAKGTIAAGIMAAALAFMPEAATAKTNIRIGIGAGPGWCFSHPYAPGCGYGYGYGYGYYPPIGFYHRPYYRGYYEPNYYYAPRYGISCGEAKQIVRDSGFRNVRTRSCSGTTNSFTGVKRGNLWLVKVNTRNGRIASVRPL